MTHDTRHDTPRAATRRGRHGQWWLNRSVRAKGLIVVAIPLTALLSMGAASLVLQHSESQARALALRASNLSNAANQLLVDTLNAETGVRGYALTTAPVFLAPYNLMRARIDGERASLQDAAAAEGDTSDQRLADTASSAALADITQLLQTVNHGASTRQITAALQTGKVAMDHLRSRIAGLIAGPARLVAAQRTHIADLETAINTLTIAGLVVGVLAGVLGIALFTSGISRRVVQAAANADRLGRGQPLRPVPHSGDDLGRLAGSLVRAEQLLASQTTQMMAARDEALQANQAKNAFLSHTSHELRTPLNSILGFTQLLEISDLTDGDRDSVTRILSAGRHLLTLINELIDTARIESGELTLSVEPVSVLALIQETSHLLTPLADQRSITISHHCPHPALAVRADRLRLSQVLMNLISNAVKYNRRGGTITITCQHDGTDRVDILVCDTGPGLSAQDLRRIFVPFDRLGAELTSTEGTGIGLPLAKGLTEAMGGHLSATSVPGEGSTFTVRLRRAPDMIHPEPVDTGGAQPVVRTTTAGHTSVLYIEDNPANIALISRFMKTRTNTTLRTARSGRAGIDCAIQHLPDLILLDLHLPDLPGDQVFEELKAEPATSAIPVVVLSADASPRIIRRLMARGVHAYLTKPIDLAKLAIQLDSVTGFAPDPDADLPDVTVTATGPPSPRRAEHPVEWPIR